MFFAAILLLPEMGQLEVRAWKCGTFLLYIMGRCGILYISETGGTLSTRFGEHIVVLSKAVMQTNLFARHFNNGNHCVSDMKIRAFCPISGSNMIAARKYEMHHISNVGTVHLLGINKRFSYI